jgi:hypothetical protein
MLLPPDPPREGRSVRAEALHRLCVTEEDLAQEIKITPHLKAIADVIRRKGQEKIRRIAKVGIRDPVPTEDILKQVPPPYGPGADVAHSWPWYLEASTDPDARAILRAYHLLPKYLSRAVPIESFCIAAKVSSVRALEIIVVTCMRLGVQAENIIAAVNRPRIVQKTVDMAMTDEGVEDRMMFHKATGFLPTPKGAQTTIQVVQSTQVSANAQVAAAPPPEQTIRRMVNRFNESKQLPQESGVVVRIPEVMPHEEIEENEAALVNAINGDADEEEEAELNP